MRFLICLLTGALLGANWVSKNTLAGEFTSVEVDEHGDVYLVNSKKQLIRYNAQLDTLYIFNEKSAEVDLVAPQNSLKILTFNKSLNTIQFLDKTLSPSADELNLDEVDIPLVEAVGISKDNNFWVFDQYNQSLKKFDAKMNLISTSGNLINITGLNWSPTQLKEIDNKVFVCDSSKGIMEFDFFGSYSRTINLKVSTNFYYNHSSIWFVRNDSLIVHDILLQEQSKFSLPVKNVHDFALYKSQFYLLTQEKLYIYGLSK
ncbi:MAG: hypothetical protein CMP67_09225 [Flavobacteriales bacterium]|nr:hypothetical protein [Flavobacteriales bacterium]MBO72460.1 hypothetical protein [Flavobacteriales bacterium]|tara:strand:+ start:1515 stop:2294 length:780 start_codon:yes stop_codon:yes gene_type:complete